jgi:signal transduction histidine kinase
MKPWQIYSRYALSGKLIVLFIGFTLLSMVLVGASMRYGFRAHFQENVRPHLVQYLEYVQQDLGFPPNRQRAQELADRLNIEIHIIEGSDQWSSSGQAVDLDYLDVKHRYLANGREYMRVESASRDYLMMREAAMTLLFRVPDAAQERKGGRGVVPLLVLFLILMGLYYATRRLFSPIHQIQKGVQRFGAGDLDHRIEVNRRDELGELANSVNGMADDIQQMLDAKRQLLLAISHELRTPLTRARVATEMIDNAHLKAQLNQDLQEMDTMIEEIMETERLSMNHAILNRQQHDIKQLIHETVATHFRDSPLKLSVPDTPLTLSVDAPRVRLMIKNLIENALRYTPDGAHPPEVLLQDHVQEIDIVVRDHGRGIEDRHLQHLTEAFYRVDPSRQRETGGYGLGLYLCRMIAEAHGGRLRIDSTLGQGTTVTISLPRT